MEGKHMYSRDLFDKLSHCIYTCNYCSDACLGEPDVKKMVSCIKLDRDCADICSITLGFVSRNSERTPALLALCAEICRSCARECSKHEAEHCQKCAEACTACANACEEAKSIK